MDPTRHPIQKPCSPHRLSEATMNSHGFVIGVDVGGTKIAAGLVDSEGRIFNPIRKPTNTSSPEASIQSIASVVDTVIVQSGVERKIIQGVGLGIPGLVDPVLGVGIASVNLQWRDVPVKAQLEEMLDISCTIENDVRAAAMGEACYGAGQGVKNLIYISIGTGIACGIILEGKLLHGSNGLAGEIGHAMIDIYGPLCKCGGYGCFEALAAGPAIATTAISKMQFYQDNLLLELCEKKIETLTSEMVFQAAEQGDPLAKETLDIIGSYVAFVLQFLILAYDPQLVVLGGGVPLTGNLFFEPVLKRLQKRAAESWVLAKALKPGLVQLTSLGENIGILGAAALVSSPQ
jgi:glucokinase